MARTAQSGLRSGVCCRNVSLLRRKLAEVRYATRRACLRFADAAVKCRQVTGGPGDGGAGVLFTLNQRDKPDLDQQTWRRIPGGKAWCGHWNDERPTADSLLRPKALQDTRSNSATAAEWHVPIARTVDDNPSGAMLLSRKIVTNDEGEWIYGEVIERCRRLWQIVKSGGPRLVADRLSAAKCPASIRKRCIDGVGGARLQLSCRSRGTVHVRRLGTDWQGKCSNLLCDVPKVLWSPRCGRSQAEKKKATTQCQP